MRVTKKWNISFANSLYLFVLIASIFSIVGCAESGKEKDLVTLTGAISNNSEEHLEIFNFNSPGPPEKIKIEADGTFSGTFKMEKPDIIFINYADKQHRIFVRNGYELHLTWDGSKDEVKEQLWLKDLEISGYGSDIATSYNSTMFDTSDRLQNDVFKMNRADFEKLLDERISKRLSKAPTSDTAYTTFYKQTLKDRKDLDLENYDTQQKNLAQIGTLSPQFVDYENIDGKKVSLEDFKGKYVFMDFWATWCVPCIAEMPHLKELEKAYHGKNIEFIGISIDVEKRKDAWKKMVKEKELTGVQLINYNEQKSKFIKNYKIEAIPRYILLDPEGKIVSADAPVPSQKEEIAELFGSLNL